jgi:hypothetical protein
MNFGALSAGTGREIDGHRRSFASRLLVRFALSLRHRNDGLRICTEHAGSSCRAFPSPLFTWTIPNQSLS